MTQRTWTTTDGWNVLTGWDRPLQHYFLQISRLCTYCEGTGENEYGDECATCRSRGEMFLFDNLDSNNPLTGPMGGMSLEQIDQALRSKLTEYPKNLLAFLRNDKAKNLGNDIAVMETIGEAKK